MNKFDVRDLKLAKTGKQRIEWASREMRVVGSIRQRMAKEKPFKGIRISGCLHVTTETANLALTLKDGGADLILCASNPLSTQDNVAAALVEYGIPVYAIKGEDQETYYKHIGAALDHRPQLTVDDGADLVTSLHSSRRELLKGVIGGTEETTTGVTRLRALAKARKLEYPIIAVNDAKTKYLFDNRYGTGQSTIDGITRATNVLWAGKKVVVCGYGWCGHGLALRAKGLGSQVLVCEVDPVKALEAAMDGLQVMPLKVAARVGDVFITVTGDKNVIDAEHFEMMKDGAILANSGHFNVEINIPALAGMSRSRRMVRDYVEEFQLQGGKRLFLLGDGRLINLAAAEGHPASVMDMSFADQALSLEYILENHESMANDVYSVPERIDNSVAAIKLASMGIKIDRLTREQKRYLTSWQEGT